MVKLCFIWRLKRGGENNQPSLCTGTGKSTLVSKIWNGNDSASLVVDCKSLALGWISLSLYKVVVDSISLILCFNLQDKKTFCTIILRKVYYNVTMLPIACRRMWTVAMTALCIPKMALKWDFELIRKAWEKNKIKRGIFATSTTRQASS